MPIVTRQIPVDLPHLPSASSLPSLSFRCLQSFSVRRLSHNLLTAAALLCRPWTAGAIYTYDRLVFEFLGPHGKPTVVPELREIRRNFIYGNYQSYWPIDHDDGSQRYIDAENVLMYGGTKSYLGGHSKTAAGNLLLWPNINGWGSATMMYASVVNASGYDEPWQNNTVVLGPAIKPSKGDGYTDFASCNLATPSNPPTPLMRGNTVWLPEPVETFSTKCGAATVTLAAWQASGRDLASRFEHGAPSDAELVAKAKALLGL
eukprot:SAG22_NODE_447_length_10412_cov_7.930088_7_plen_261_part_00